MIMNSENLIDLLNYVLFNLDSFKIVNEYIVFRRGLF